MDRRDLGPRDGMIFVFDRDDHLTFWMKNTPTPLSIAFLSVGRESAADRGHGAIFDCPPSVPEWQPAMRWK